MRFIENNTFFFLTISLILLLLTRLLRGVFELRDNPQFKEVKENFRPSHFFLNIIYGEGLILYISLLSSVSFFMFAFSISKKVVATLGLNF